MRLYSYYRSSATYRVRIGLALKSIPYEYVAIDVSPSARAQHGADFAAVNAMQQVPVLEWMEGGEIRRLAQSVAILEYLDERWPTPPLLPGDAFARARVREAVEIVNSGMQPLQNLRVMELAARLGGPDAADAFRRESITLGLEALERLARPNRGPFFLGDAPTLADLFIVPQLYNAHRFEVDVRPYPRLAALEAHALTHTAFRTARPEAQPDAPPT